MKHPQTPLLEAVAGELLELEAQHPAIVLSITPLEAFSLIGVLQLALRHPEMNGDPRDVAERIKESLALAIGGTPAIAAIIAMGEDPAFDR